MEGGAWTYLVKHGVHDIALGKESVGVEVGPEPYEDLLTHIYVWGENETDDGSDNSSLQNASAR